MSDVPEPLSANEFFTPEFLRDPYPSYRRYLDERGLQYLSIHGGVWAVFKHADCSTFLRDPRLSAKRTGTLIDEFPAEKQREFAELARTFSLWMLFYDAPEHTRLRKLMNRGFSAAAIESLKPQVEKIVDRFLMPLRNNHRIDILPQFAHPLPAYVIAEMLSVPESLHQQFVRWSNAIANLFGNPYRTVDDLIAAQQAIDGLTDYFREAVAVRRKEKGNDLISLLMQIEEDGDAASPPRTSRRTSGAPRTHPERRRGATALRKPGSIHGPNGFGGFRVLRRPSTTRSGDYFHARRGQSRCAAVQGAGRHGP